MGMGVAVTCLARGAGTPWKPPTWLGIVAGLLVGLGVWFVCSVRDDNGTLGELVPRSWFAASVVMILAATWGGLAGHGVELVMHPPTGRRSGSSRSRDK